MADVIADFAVRIGAIVSPFNAALADAAVNGERFTALQTANADAIRYNLDHVWDGIDGTTAFRTDVKFAHWEPLAIVLVSQT